MENLKCPHCGSIHINKQGFLPSGKRRYLCKDCKKGFSSNIEIQKKITKCYYCNSENTVKAGKTKHNTQVYLCNDCKRRFNEGKIQYDFIETPCPNCGGELRYKGWSNNGSVRRFKCSSCKKTFSGDLSNLRIKTIDMPCPYCGSEDVRKGGLLKSGVKRYKCNDCGKGFNANTVPVEPAKRPEKCPKCGGTHINLCGHDTKTGKQRYKCISCSYRFVENPQYPTPIVWEKECPRCKHVGARKAGKSNGKQYYQCFECGHKYLEGGLYKQIDERKKKQIIYLYIKGKTAPNIAEKLQTTERTVRNIMASYYKQEKLSTEQKQLIYKFGIECAVPVDYLAPYINCTKKICKEYLANFKPIERKPYKRTERDIAFDNMELDKFMRC